MDSSIVSNAAGSAKNLLQAEQLARSASGVVRMGSYMPLLRPGNSGRVYWCSPDGRFSLNALGIPSPPYEQVAELVPKMADVAHREGKALEVSPAGTTPKDYGQMAGLLDCGADFLEVNAGCPNIWVEGKQKPIASYHPESLREILVEVEKRIGTSRMDRVRVKVSPFFYAPVFFSAAVGVEVDAAPPGMEVFEQIAEIVVKSGVSRVVTMNTVPRSRIRAEDGKWAIDSPEVPEGYGGLAGPVVKPFGLREVNMWRAVLPPHIEVVGVGGIRTGQDVLDYLQVGASRVQIGTEFYGSQNPRIFGEILKELVELPGAQEFLKTG